jgi:hypothetical protein
MRQARRRPLQRFVRCTRARPNKAPVSPRGCTGCCTSRCRAIPGPQPWQPPASGQSTACRACPACRYARPSGLLPPAPAGRPGDEQRWSEGGFGRRRGRRVRTPAWPAWSDHGCRPPAMRDRRSVPAAGPASRCPLGRRCAVAELVGRSQPTHRPKLPAGPRRCIAGGQAVERQPAQRAGKKHQAVEREPAQRAGQEHLSIKTF